MPLNPMTLILEEVRGFAYDQTSDAGPAFVHLA